MRHGSRGLTLWMKSTAEAAKSACTTWLSPGMSSPLAAASVHTITMPSLKQSYRPCKDHTQPQAAIYPVRIWYVPVPGALSQQRCER